MAAKLPAAPITRMAMSCTSRRMRWTMRTASPPPIRISGASGPSTAPRPRVANDAKKAAGSSLVVVEPPVLNPSAGWGPPVPGR